MKNYRVKFKDGENIELLGVEFDAQVYTNALNDPKVIFVNLSGLIVNKEEILKMVPFTDEE